MMDFTRDEEQSLTSALHTKRHRGYGAAVAPSQSGAGAARVPALTVTHIVAETDTLHALAVKYDSRVADIKRLNGLWNNESLVLRDTVKVPVYSDVNISIDVNGHAELPSTSASSSGMHRPTATPARTGKTNGATAQPTDTADFFSKFDSSLTSIRKKVARQVENSASLLEEDDLLFTSLAVRHGSKRSDSSSTTSAASSSSSKGKGRAGSGSLTSLGRLSSSEDIQSTPDPTVVKSSRHLNKLHKYEVTQDEQLFRL